MTAKNLVVDDSPIEENDQFWRNCRVPPNDRNLAHSSRSSPRT